MTPYGEESMKSFLNPDFLTSSQVRQLVTSPVPLSPFPTIPTIWVPWTLSWHSIQPVLVLTRRVTVSTLDIGWSCAVNHWIRWESRMFIGHLATWEQQLYLRPVLENMAHFNQFYRLHRRTLTSNHSLLFPQCEEHKSGDTRVCQVSVATQAETDETHPIRYIDS